MACCPSCDTSSVAEWPAPFTTVDQFQTAVKGAGHSATLLVSHDGQQAIVTITLQ